MFTGKLLLFSFFVEGAPTAGNMFYYNNLVCVSQNLVMVGMGYFCKK